MCQPLGKATMQHEAEMVNEFLIIRDFFFRGAVPVETDRKALNFEISQVLRFAAAPTTFGSEISLRGAS